MLCVSQCREKAQMQQSHLHELNTINKQNHELNDQLCMLRDDKHVLERKLTELLHKYSSCDALVSTLQEESGFMRKQVQDLLRYDCIRS